MGVTWGTPGRAKNPCDLRVFGEVEAADTSAKIPSPERDMYSATTTPAPSAAWTARSDEVGLIESSFGHAANPASWVSWSRACW